MSQAGLIAIPGGTVVNSVTAGQNINLTGTAANPIINVNNQIQQPNGSSALPSYSFATDPTMGFYWRGASDMSFSINGDLVLFQPFGTTFLAGIRPFNILYAGIISVNNAASPFTINPANTIYLTCDTSGGAITLLFPNNPNNDGQLFIVKDATGNAAANNITVTTVSGVKTFDGSTSKLINVNFGSMSFIYNNTTGNYEII